MKRHLFPLILSFLTLFFFGSFTYVNKADECYVVKVYQAVPPNDSDTKVITTSGEFEEVEYLLLPTELELGKYKVNITRKEDNFYKVEGTKFWLETSSCYEYFTYEEVILVISSNIGGSSSGKIVFED